MEQARVAETLSAGHASFLADWNALVHQHGVPPTVARVNEYIEKWEAWLETFGRWVRGHRARTGDNLPHHETLAGTLGILSMNVEICRRKAARGAF